MSLPGNGIFVVRGEMSIMITAMRHYTRKWNSTYVDEDKDSLIKRFMRVKTLLNRIEDLRKIKPQIYLKPFLEVIRSEETTGADTSLALAAINKFLSCGLLGKQPNTRKRQLTICINPPLLLLSSLDSSIPNLALIVQSIVDAVRHARFRGADQSSDIITIFGVVEVLHTLMLRPEGEALTNEAVCEVMYSCFKICFEPRTNSTQLLQRFAEKALKDIVLLLFTRLPLFPEEDYSETTGCVKKIQMSTTDKTNNRKAIPNANHRNERIERDERKMVSIASTSAAAEPLNFSAPENMSQINTSASACDVNTNVVELQTSLRTGARGTSTTTSTTTIGETPSPTLEASNSQTAIINVGAGILTETTNQSEIPTDNSQDLRTSNERESRCNNESDYINSLGVRFTQQQQYPQQEQQFTTTTGNSGDDSTSNLLPYGLPCIQELFRFLVLLCNPLDIQNTDIMKHMGLSLLTAAFEVAADSLGKYETILELIKGDLCRYLLALLTSERLSIFAADLQLSFLLFRSLRGHLKYQLEAYLKKLSEIILNDNLKMQIRELALDNLLQLWCTPNFVTELYINYDCDAYCSNVFEDITNLLCKYILTKENVDNTHLIATDAILTVVYNIEHNCSLKMKNGNSDDDGGDGEEEDSNKADAYVDNYLVKNGTMAQSSSSCLIRHSRDNSDLEGIIIDSMNHVTNETSPGINSTQSLDTDNQVSEVEGAPSSSTLAQEYLVNLKRRKQLIAHGTELFNQRTEKGAKYCGKAIEYLQKHGILKVPLDPREIATFLRENPSLDKRNIGEYICKKDIIEAKILKYYVESFDFTNMSVDQALRSFLEEFRLSGEAPVILLVLECFVDHWREQNGEPFANADAAFTLAYSIILLNTDQHNANAKSSNVPMTEEHFRKNLRGANGGDDFDQDMLASIYNSIKNEEIVIPAEQTGIIRDNYIWRVLLRRGSSPDANYKFVNHSMYDLIIFKIIWGPTLSSLSFMFDKTNEHGYKRILKGFTKCAGIIFHYNLYEDFDALILTLCKFTTLLPMIQQELPSSPISTIHHLISNEQAVNFGRKPKAQAAMRTVFNLVHDYGDCLREGWRHIFDLYLQLFRLKLLPKSLMEVEDFCEATGKAQLILEKPSQQKQESGLFSSLYSYLSSDGQREPSLEEKELIKVAKKCIKDCQLDQMIQESKFVHYDSLQELLKHVLNLLKAPTAHKSIGLPYAEDAVVFWMEFLVKIVIYNRDRMIPLWLAVRNHMYFLLMGAAFCGYDYLLNRCIVAILKLAIYLMRNEELCPIVLKSLKMLVMLKPQAILKISKQISIGIYELLKTSAQNIHTKEDWQIVFLILECVGAGREPPEIEDITLSMPLNGAWAKSDGALSSDGSDSGLPDKDRDKDYVSESEVFGGLNINITPYSSTKQTMPKSMIPKSVVTTTTNCSNTNSPPHPSSPISENWILVNKESDLNILSRPQSPSIKGGISPPLTTLIYNCTLMPHSPFALFKCWDSLAFIVRNVAHITPYNFESCVRCIRTFVEASINGGWKAKSSAIGVDGIGCSNQKRTKHKRLSQYSHEPSKHVISPSGSDEENACEPDNTDLAQRYETLSIQLLDLMYTLYTRTAQIFRWWAEEGCAVPQGSDLWIQGWCPVLQGIARLAMDRRREVRTYAISCLQQRALLVHDLQALSSKEWASCFYQVLFPLLNDLLPESASVRHLDAQLLEESRIRIATIMAKVFLHHLAPLLELDDFNELWLQILTYIEKFMSVRSDMLKEQMQEVLKNMLLVMHSVRVFHNPNSNLWSITWHRIGQFLPELKRELFHNEDHNTTNNNNNSNDSSNNNILTSSQRTHQTLITPSMDILDQKSHNNNNNNNNNNNSNNSISDKNYYNVTSTASKAAISLRTELFSPLLSPIDSPRQSGSSSIILQPPTPDIISCPTLLSQIPVIVPQCVSQSLDIGITAEYSSLNFKTKDMDQQLERQQQQQQQQQQQRQELEQEQEQENHYNYQLQQQSIVSDTSSFSNMKTAIVTAAETIVDATAYNVNHPTGNLINEGNSTSFTIELPEITANDHHNVDTKNLIGLKQYQYAEQSDYNPIKVDNPLIMSQQLYSATTEAQASTTAIIANSSNNDCDDVTANAIFNANLCNNDIDHKESYTDTSVNVSLTPIIAATNAYPSLSHPPTTAIMHSFAPVRISNQQAQQMQQWQKQQQQQQQTVQSTEIKQSSITTDIYQEYLQNPYNLTLNQSCLMPHICETTTTATVTMTTVATVTTITTPTTTTKTMTTSTTLGTIPGAIIKVTLQQQQQQEQQQEEQNCQRQPGEIVAASVVFTPANYFSKSLDGGNGVSDDDEWLRGGDGRP